MTTVSSSASARRQALREAQKKQAAQQRRRRLIIQLAVVGGVAVVAIAIVASAVLLGERGRGTAPSANTTISLDGASVPFAVDGSAVRVGPADAKAQVDLWVDYSCPHCQEFEAANNDVLNSLIAGGGVAVSYHNIQIHAAYGTQAGSAGACVAAKDPERWPAFNAALYRNQSVDTADWKAADFKTFAAQQGVSPAAQDCIGASTYTGWIKTNTEDAADQNVNGTPTMFLNGQPSETLSGQALTDRVKALAGR